MEEDDENYPPTDNLALVSRGDDNMKNYGEDDDLEMYNNAERLDDEYHADEDVQLPGVDDLPLFASLEARKVDADIKQKETEIEVLSDKVADMNQRLKVMKSHFKNVQQELDHTNELSVSKTAEMQTEKHLRQLTSRAVGQNQAETKKLQLELEKVQDDLSLVQTNIHKSNEKMDEFKMKMNWNQEELERWAVAAKQKEEDSLALQKYTRADEAKIKDVDLMIEQLTREQLKTKGLLDLEKLDTLTKQIELDRIAEEFKKLHLERQQLVSRWQDAIGEIKNRDWEINALGERFAIAKTERVKKEAKVQSQVKRLERQQLENREVESRAEALGRTVSRKREEMMSGSLKLQVFRDELESHKNELTIAADSLITKRSQNSHKSQANEEKKVKLERERLKYKFVKTSLENFKNNTMKAEEIARQAELELQQREQEYEAQILRIKTLKEKLFRETQGVHDTKREETRLRNEISGAKSISKNLEFQLNMLDKEASRQQELLYNAEFQIQQIERKVARGMGERSDEEKRQLRGQIAECEARLEKAKEKRKMLNAQSRKLQNELAALRIARDDAVTLKTKLVEKQVELELANRMIEEEIRRETKDKEESSVQNDLMRLEVRRLRDLLSAKADAVFSLENRRQQLMLSMEERTGEISVHRDVLKVELRSLNEEKHRVTMELRNGESTVDKLRARFEVLAKGDGEGRPQSYYIIKAAQKREELQRKGDELDQSVRKCEREIRALQTTLDHLNARNTAYRNSFQKVDLKGDDAEILKQLEDRTKAARDFLFRKKKELQRISTDFEEDNRRLDLLTIQTMKIEKQKEHLIGAQSQVSEEIFNQKVQMDELTERAERITMRHRSKVCETSGLDPSVPSNMAMVTLEEKAAQAEVLKDVVQNVLYTLGQLAIEFPEVSDLLALKLDEAELKMPPRPPSQPTGRSRTGSMNGTKGTTYTGRPGTSGSDVTSQKSTSPRGVVSGGSNNTQGRSSVRPSTFQMGI